MRGVARVWVVGDAASFRVVVAALVLVGTSVPTYILDWVSDSTMVSVALTK